MTDDFTELDNVGPAREEKFTELGYDEYTDLAEVEPATLADEVSRLPEDSALEIIVQAQNLAELETAEVEENPDSDPDPSETVTVDGEDDSGTVESDTVNVTEKVVEADETVVGESGDDGEDVHELRLEIETVNEYHAMYACLLSYRRKLIGTNQSGVGQAEDVLEQLQESVVGDELVVSMEASGINDLHNALLQYRLDCQGKNMNEFLSAARALESKYNNERERLLF